MNLIILIGVITILLFGFVVFFGAPYLPTRKIQTDTALDLLDLKKGQTLLELGCGDGRVLRAAAQRGLNGVGYELNPLLVVVAWLNTLRYHRQVSIRWGNYWTAVWPPMDGIYVFLLDKYMARLDNKIKLQGRPVKLASFAFKVPGQKPRQQKAGIFLYHYN